ncbi:hypothetical protein U0070_020770 [Myodes glareolus]|uniref:Uncharacterized protein n=1 Tax=Myodes glareolus TaxID=447135 RepID=A0AAW0IDD5_MYOGA
MGPCGLSPRALHPFRYPNLMRIPKVANILHFMSQPTAVSPIALPPKPVFSAPSLVIQAWAARAGPGSLPPQDPTSRPPPASCPPAPRGLCSLFLRAALPPAAGSRRHCLEPPGTGRPKEAGALRSTGALTSASPSPSPAPPRATLTDASHPTGIGLVNRSKRLPIHSALQRHPFGI